mmetsp:Transcript_43282/g.68549  ORF Transcript_43282/g.68549 Transcript_43282/m.68549 type:complete len:208 (+) Transcript_43282:1411-2034(+)
MVGGFHCSHFCAGMSHISQGLVTAGCLPIGARRQLRRFRGLVQTTQGHRRPASSIALGVLNAETDDTQRILHPEEGLHQGAHRLFTFAPKILPPIVTVARFAGQVRLPLHRIQYVGPLDGFLGLCIGQHLFRCLGFQFRQLRLHPLAELRAYSPQNMAPPDPRLHAQGRHAQPRHDRGPGAFGTGSGAGGAAGGGCGREHWQRRRPG